MCRPHRNHGAIIQDRFAGIEARKAPSALAPASSQRSSDKGCSPDVKPRNWDEGAGDVSTRARRSSGLLDLLGLLLLAADLDLARPHRLRDLTNKIDGEQPVYEISLRHLDVIRQVEGALEGAAGDAVMQIERLLERLLVGVLAA